MPALTHPNCNTNPNLDLDLLTSESNARQWQVQLEACHGHVQQTLSLLTSVSTAEAIFLL